MALWSAGAAAVMAADLPPGRFARVEVAPARTSIYVGTVSMTMPPFARQDAGYQARYSAKVFPYFFYSEEGTLVVDVSEDMLRRLAAGEPVEFGGRARSDDGAERRVEARAVPVDAATGRIKVRVFVSRRLELIFNTTYRFLDPEPRPGEAKATRSASPPAHSRPAATAAGSSGQ
jgi:hypothetical protein